MSHLPKNSAYRSSIEFTNSGVIEKKNQEFKDYGDDFSRGIQSYQPGHKSYNKSSLLVNPFSIAKEAELDLEGSVMTKGEINDKLKNQQVKMKKEQIYILQVVAFRR